MDREIISWIDPGGVEHILSGQDGIEVLIGPEGRFMPPFSFVEEEVPFQAGSRLRKVNVKAREVDLPIEISSETPLGLRIKIRELLKAFNPLRGDGILKSTSLDGTQRILTCRYTGGLEIKESGSTWQQLILVLKAFDPYWYDVITHVETFKTGQPATFFPIFPLRLSSSTVFADIVVHNEGDAETWPEWIINGPGDHIILRNLTTGETFNLNASIGLGETITIDTKPRLKTVKKNNGENIFSLQTSSSSLWALKEGKNNIRIEMSSANDKSSIQLSYKNRYWGP